MDTATGNIELQQKSPIASRLRRDFRLLVFYLLPTLEGFREDLIWMAAQAVVPVEVAEGYRDELLESRFWIRSETGAIRVSRANLGIGDGRIPDEVSPSEFLTMISHLLYRLSDDGPCWYESRVVSTSNELKMEFLSQINKLMQEFIERSAKARGETILAWAHVSLDALKALQQEEP